MPRATEGNVFVYIMRRQDNLRKMGFSVDYAERKKQLRTSFGMSLWVEQTWELEEAVGIHVEKCAHRELSNYRVPHSGKEVYDASLDIIVCAIEIVQVGGLSHKIEPDDFFTVLRKASPEIIAGAIAMLKEYNQRQSNSISVPYQPS